MFMLPFLGLLTGLGSRILILGGLCITVGFQHILEQLFHSSISPLVPKINLPWLSRLAKAWTTVLNLSWRFLSETSCLVLGFSISFRAATLKRLKVSPFSATWVSAENTSCEITKSSSLVNLELILSLEGGTQVERRNPEVYVYEMRLHQGTELWQFRDEVGRYRQRWRDKEIKKRRKSEGDRKRRK